MAGSKVVWITGASSGIGEQMVYEYCNKGYKVIASARRDSELNRVKSNSKTPDNIHVLPIDLTKTGSLGAKVDQAIAIHGQVDVLVHCGGLSQRSLVRETSIDIDRLLMDVNYFGAVALTKAILPHMERRSSGQFVVITSLTAKYGFKLRSAYAASKHALYGFFESLRMEEAIYGINVTLVVPGLIKTEISKNALNASGESTGQTDQLIGNGMDPALCARKIVRAAEKGKHEVYVGKKEILSIHIKRFFPRFFYNIMINK
jgi:dehydrogenase/reductase SDR family protein 7B